MLEACEGDCLFIEFVDEGCTFSMLIDTGPIACWESALRPFLDRLHDEGKHIDVLLLSHYDADHIGGALRLFEDDGYSRLINQVWFNGPRQIVPSALDKAAKEDHQAYCRILSAYGWSFPASDEPISAQQAESLSAMLDRRSKSVNAFIGGMAITGNTPSLQIAPGFWIDFLLPSEHRLKALSSKFCREANQACRGIALARTPDAETAFEAVLLGEDISEDVTEDIAYTIPNLNHIKEWASCSNKKDLSDTNASSIAICIRFHGRRLLFPGDATGEDLATALAYWQEAHHETSDFDVVKMPHHGSFQNCAKLLDTIDGKYFLFLTDGAKYAHPDKETLAKTVIRPRNGMRFLLFNYENAMLRLFRQEAVETEYGYCAMLSEGTLELDGDG